MLLPSFLFLLLLAEGCTNKAGKAIAFVAKKHFSPPPAFSFLTFYYIL